MGRLGSYTVTTDVEVDLQEVLDEISDEELEEELALRKKLNIKKDDNGTLIELIKELANISHSISIHHSRGAFDVCPEPLCREATATLARLSKKGG